MSPPSKLVRDGAKRLGYLKVRIALFRYFHPTGCAQLPGFVVSIPRFFTMSQSHPLATVRQRIAQAAQSAGRDPQSVTLLAVSKTFPAQDVAQLAALGQTAFGENYVQEALDKIAALRADWPALQWHFIGPLQSNKTREVAAQFDWVHSVERLKIAQRLSDQRPPQLPPLQVCIQVNVDGEATKSGVTPDDVGALAAAVAALPNLRLRGLMCIPAPREGLDAQRAPFARLRALRDAIAAEHGLALDTLSMGMSADLEAAVIEGATIVRVGSALFGQRAAVKPSLGAHGMVCRRFRIAGKVQGVGYRAHVQAEALRLGLRGHALNRADGTVEVLACGAPAALGTLQHWLWQGSPACRVDSVHAEDAPCDACGDGFRIK